MVLTGHRHMRAVPLLVLKYSKSVRFCPLHLTKNPDGKRCLDLTFLARVVPAALLSTVLSWHRVLNSVFNLQKTSFDIVAVPNQRNMKHSCLHILNIQQDNVCIISQIALSTCCSWKRLHYSLCNKQVKDDCKNKQQKMTY